MKYCMLAVLFSLSVFLITCKEPKVTEIEENNKLINDPILKKLANCNKLILCKVGTNSKNGIFEIETIKLLSNIVEDVEKILFSFNNKNNSRTDYPGAGIQAEFLISSSDVIFLLRIINHDNICVLEEVESNNKKISLNTNNFNPSNMRIVSSEKLVDFLMKTVRQTISEEGQ